MRSDYAFAVTDSDHLYTFPLRDIPAIGVADVIDHSALGSLGTRIHMSHAIAMVIDLATSITTLDIRDPEQPVVLQTLSSTNPWGVAIAGSDAFVADFTDGLVTVDISP